ncbi:T-complex protein 1 subunit gamma [Thelohanellus kitauei]|uniref:T-complex protein 1 subunit gamma n=1 Tax=Thelohanellus kitauei TaxID=669202 RepID=A0A0C2M204_THEKT|nr:T-complex protein 1 subunit gamma [Thelohanellus kitauei]
MMMNAPVIIMKETQERENGRRVQLANITAAKAVADIVRTCLGPRAMLKMLLDPMGGIVITNDGNCILREIQVQHPAAKSIIEISRTQDEEVGDGTTSVVILAGELMSLAEPLLDQSVHPLQIIRGFRLALEDAIEYAKKISTPIDLTNKKNVFDVIKSCLGTKINVEYADLVSQLAWDSIQTVSISKGGRDEIDFKRYARVEKIPGGHITDSHILRGLVLNKDVVHTGMKRKILKPRILLLDCSLEYKKGESQTSLELVKAQDFNTILRLEEETVKAMCLDIIKHKPDLVFTEKGCSDLAQHYLHKAGISVIRRIKKTDNNRIARAVGATIVNRTEDITPDAIGTGAGLFEIKKIGDEYYSYILDCQDPKACSIILRGASKDIINELDRNLNDAMNAARNIKLDPRVVSGGGAFEIAVSLELEKRAKSIGSIERCGYEIAARALEVIPRTLIQNCGENQIRVLTELKSRQVTENCHNLGVDGLTGKIVNMVDNMVLDCISVKIQVLKVAFEVCMMLLKIDDIISGSKKPSEEKMGQVQAMPTEESQKD